MKFRICLLSVVVFALAAGASAQTKISAPWQCSKPDKQYSIEVGDRPNHSFAISQTNCSSSKPWEIGGVRSKGGVGTTFGEASGITSRNRYLFVETMADGDKIYYREEGTITLKDGVPQSGETRWTAVGGTGKLKGIKAKGTCKLASAAPDGSATWDCEGEYQLPTK